MTVGQIITIIVLLIPAIGGIMTFWALFQDKYEDIEKNWVMGFMLILSDIPIIILLACLKQWPHIWNKLLFEI